MKKKHEFKGEEVWENGGKGKIFNVLREKNIILKKGGGVKI